jgi:hypothetical protein
VVVVIAVVSLAVVLVKRDGRLKTLVAADQNDVETGTTYHSHDGRQPTQESRIDNPSTHHIDRQISGLSDMLFRELGRPSHTRQGEPINPRSPANNKGFGMHTDNLIEDSANFISSILISLIKWLRCQCHQF